MKTNKPIKNINQETHRPINAVKSLTESLKQAKFASQFETHLVFGQRVLSEAKVMQKLKSNLLERDVINIASSNNQELIDEFKNTINDFNMELMHSSVFLSIYHNKFDAIAYITAKEYLKLIYEIFKDYLPSGNRKMTLKKAEHVWKLRLEILSLEEDKKNIKERKLYSKEFDILNNKISRINKWKLFIPKGTRKILISKQQQEIDRLTLISEKDVSKIENQLAIKKTEIDQSGVSHYYDITWLL